MGERSNKFVYLFVQEIDIDAVAREGEIMCMAVSEHVEVKIFVFTTLLLSIVRRFLKFMSRKYIFDFN